MLFCAHPALAETGPSSALPDLQMPSHALWQPLLRGVAARSKRLALQAHAAFDFQKIASMLCGMRRILRPTNEVEEKKMSETKAGSQTIGCRVTSCRYNARGCDCQLSRIEVEPKCGCHTGEPCDESLCGSYKAK